MRNIFAIAGIALRAAIRSRMVLAMLFALLAMVPAIAYTARGDGTAMGQVQVLLTYSLGASGIILALATLWSACAAVSLEMEEGHISLLASKPVYRWQIWLGKWAGIMTLNALLLLFIGPVVAGILMYKTRPVLIGEAESAKVHENVLNARRAISPRPFDVRREAKRLVGLAIQQGRITADEASTELANGIRLLNITTNSSPRGSAALWTFDLPAHIPPGPIVLEYQGDSGSIDRDEIPVVWSIGVPGNPRIRSINQPLLPAARRTLALPREIVGDSRTITIECYNAAERDVTVFFDPQNGIRILLPGGGFAANLVRALLLQWISLGLLAALGVSAGSVFSMPVAALTAITLILVRKITIFLNTMTDGEGPQITAPDSSLFVRGFESFSRGIYHFLNTLGSPLQTESALERLSQGVQVPWAEVFRMAGISLGFFSLILFAAGAYLFSRREVALPQ